MLKTTPISILFSAEISPLCASIIFLQMANPNPVPMGFLMFLIFGLIKLIENQFYIFFRDFFLPVLKMLMFS